MPYDAHKELSQSASWSTRFPPYDWLMRSFFKGKGSPELLTSFWRSRFQCPSSVYSYLRISLVWVGCCASGRLIWCARVWLSVLGTIICRAASKGFSFPVHPVLTANLLPGSSWDSSEFDLRASGKRAAWPCHVLNVSAEEKNRTFQFQDKVTYNMCIIMMHVSISHWS